MHVSYFAPKTPGDLIGGKEVWAERLTHGPDRRRNPPNSQLLGLRSFDRAVLTQEFDSALYWKCFDGPAPSRHSGRAK